MNLIPPFARLTLVKNLRKQTRKPIGPHHQVESQIACDKRTLTPNDFGILDVLGEDVVAQSGTRSMFHPESLTGYTGHIPDTIKQPQCCKE